MEPNGSIVTRAWITLDLFAERAARIMRTGIAQRDDLDTLGSQVQIRVNPLDPAKFQIRRERPEEAQIVHAAAVLRPLIVQRDPRLSRQGHKSPGRSRHRCGRAVADARE